MGRRECLLHVNHTCLWGDWVNLDRQGVPLVVQAPGWGIGSSYIKQTLQTTTPTLFFDPRGTARSFELTEGQPVSFEAQLQDLGGVLAQPSLPQADVLGHSHGAALALNHALRHPETVKHLVLVGVGATVLSPTEEFQIRRVWHNTNEKFYKVMDYSTRLMVDSEVEFCNYISKTYPTLPKERRLQSFLGDMFQYYVTDPNQFKRNWSHLDLTDLRLQGLLEMNSKVQPESQHRVVEQLESLEVPTLVVVGQNDWVSPPPVAERLHELLPNSELLVMNKSGHFPWLEESELFNRHFHEFLGQ